MEVHDFVYRMHGFVYRIQQRTGTLLFLGRIERIERVVIRAFIHTVGIMRSFVRFFCL